MADEQYSALTPEEQDEIRKHAFLQNVIGGVGQGLANQHSAGEYFLGQPRSNIEIDKVDPAQLEKKAMLNKYLMDKPNRDKTAFKSKVNSMLSYAKDDETKARLSSLLASVDAGGSIPDTSIDEQYQGEKFKSGLQADNEKLKQDADYKKSIDVANINNRAEMAKTLAANSAKGPVYPDDVKKQIEALATSNGGLIGSSNKFKEALKILSNPKVSNDQKVVYGQSLIKTANDPAHPDALSNEERAILSPYLTFQVANFTGPGAHVGRDLPGFIEQVKNFSDGYDSTIAANNASIAKLKNPEQQNVSVQRFLDNRKQPNFFQEKTAHATDEHPLLQVAPGKVSDMNPAQRKALEEALGKAGF